MKLYTVLFVLFPLAIIANPLMTNVINEFQTDTTAGQKIEIHALGSAGNIPLIGTKVISQTETSYVDTEIILPQGGYATIDRSVLSGPFFLGLSDGAFWVYLQECFTDWLLYPDTPSIPAPQPGTSVARYVFDYYPTSNPHFDWYLDSTPTFGEANDDYPGCHVSGYIFLGSNPFQGAQVIADCYDSILNPQPFHTIDTTYSLVDGFYFFDSLVSARYYINVTIAGYSPMGELTRVLHASRPINNFNFTFNGIDEYENQSGDHFSISPNPFRKATILCIESPDGDPERPLRTSGHIAKSMEIKIYDIDGRLVKSFSVPYALSPMPSALIWGGDDMDGNFLPAGVYLCRYEADKKILTTKIVKLE